MEWSDGYAIGVKDIDEQHQELVHIVGKFKILLGNKDPDILGEMGRIITFLVRYTKYHFEAEETLMADWSYPGLDEHRQIHQDLIRQIENVLKKLKNHSAYTPTEFYFFLRKWLTNHILMEDRKIGQFRIRTQGIKDETSPVFDEPGKIVATIAMKIRDLEMKKHNGLISGDMFIRKRSAIVNQFFLNIEIKGDETTRVCMSSIELLRSQGHIDEVEALRAREFILKLVEKRLSDQSPLPV